MWFVPCSKLSQRLGPMRVLALFMLCHFCESSFRYFPRLEYGVEAEAAGPSSSFSYSSINLAIERLKRVSFARVAEGY